MKKRTGLWIIGILLFMILLVGGIWTIGKLNNGGEDPNNNFDHFDSEGRYDDSVLNYMDVIYTNQSEVLAVNEAYSNTVNCPWGFVHEGFDYFMKNNTAVLSATPGRVFDVAYTDNGEGSTNRYWVAIWIQFNETVNIGYNFESWTTDQDDWELQKSMISVQVGDWIEQGEEVGRFLNAGGAGHIHFDVIEDNERQCLTKYFSIEAYNEITSLIHSYHIDWELCYIE